MFPKLNANQDGKTSSKEPRTPESLARPLEPEYRQLEGEQTARNELLPSSNVVNLTSESHLASSLSISAPLRPSHLRNGTLGEPSGKRIRTPRVGVITRDPVGSEMPRGVKCVRW